mmetsp:Transcript_44840/g.104750  ORF Transcript_44840/g.104750 Transcript_44840/m.104750 type:complete len:140 (+) Transcript_44840:159-578(+)
MRFDRQLQHVDRRVESSKRIRMIGSVWIVIRKFCRPLQVGMLSSGLVHGLLHEAADLVARGAVPWAALTVWGFSDAPVSWGVAEHEHHHDGAENDYSIFLLPRSGVGGGVECGVRCVVVYAIHDGDAFHPPVQGRISVL